MFFLLSCLENCACTLRASYLLKSPAASRLTDRQTGRHAGLQASSSAISIRWANLLISAVCVYVSFVCVRVCVCACVCQASRLRDLLAYMRASIPADRTWTFNSAIFDQYKDKVFVTYFLCLLRSAFADHLVNRKLRRIFSVENTLLVVRRDVCVALCLTRSRSG